MDLPQGLQAALGDRYAVVREVGRGGMATVYLAEDVKHRRQVAVKVLHPDLASILGRTRFLREIEIAASLIHPGIIPLYDSGVTDDVTYYVMPYVEGDSLRERLDREKQLPLESALRIAREVGDALSHAHAHQIIHRDIKPANILLSGSHALVADFGIARAVTAAGGELITTSGLAVGTPAYMSPEQASAKDPVDQRTDIYALGCVVYEMLAGQPPFTGATAQAVLAQHRLEHPPSLEVVRPGVGHAVQHVVDKALAKAPADRFQTVAEFVAALERAAVSPESGEYVPERVRARRRWRVGAGAGVLVLVSVTLAIWAPWVPKVPLDPNKVMGFPLRAQGAATQSDADVVMQGIGNALVHTEPLKWLDPWGIVDPALREHPGTTPAAVVRRLALRHGARFYVTGVVSQVGDSQTVTLELYDTRADSFVSREVAGGRQPAAVLGLRAVNALLPRLVGRSTHVDEAWLNPRRPAAVVNWLQGEVAYRRARYEEAMGFYRRALAEDSGLVVAALKGAIAAAWINEYPAGDSLVRLALRREAEMPPRNARMAHGLRFFFLGDGDSALVWFRSALAADPEWSEGWYAVGEAYLHLAPSGIGLDSLADAAFAQAVHLDSTFAPPLRHLAELAIGRGDLRRGRRLAAQFERISDDSLQWDKLRRMARCVADGPRAADWAGVVRDGHADVALDAARLYSGGMRQPACALAAFDAVAHGDTVDGGIRWDGIQGVFFANLANGDTARAVAFADSVVAVDPPWVTPLYIMGAMLRAMPERRAEVVMRPYVLRIDSMSRGRLAFFGAWYAYRRDLPRVDSVRIVAASRADTSAVWRSWADATAARLALLRRDTSSALQRLRRLRAVGDVGSLAWGMFESRALERMELVRLLMVRGEVQEALGLAGEFDRAILINLGYLRESLEIRRRAAEVLGRRALAATFRDRLDRLRGRAGGQMQED